MGVIKATVWVLLKQPGMGVIKATVWVLLKQLYGMVLLKQLYGCY